MWASASNVDHCSKQQPKRDIHGTYSFPARAVFIDRPPSLAWARPCAQSWHKLKIKKEKRFLWTKEGTLSCPPQNSSNNNSSFLMTSWQSNNTLHPKHWALVYLHLPGRKIALSGSCSIKSGTHCGNELMNWEGPFYTTVGLYWLLKIPGLIHAHTARADKVPEKPAGSSNNTSVFHRLWARVPVSASNFGIAGTC